MNLLKNTAVAAAALSLLLLWGCGNEAVKPSSSGGGSANGTSSGKQVQVQYGMHLYDANQNPIDMTKPVTAVYTGSPITYYLELTQYSDFHLNVTGVLLVDGTLQPFTSGKGSQELSSYQMQLSGKNAEKMVGVTFTPVEAKAGEPVELTFLEAAQTVGLPKGEVLRSESMNTFSAKLQAADSTCEISGEPSPDKIAKSFKATGFSLPKDSSILSGFSQKEEGGAKPDWQTNMTVDKTKPLYISMCRQPGSYRVFLLLDNVPVKAFAGKFSTDVDAADGNVEQIPVDASVLPASGKHDVCLLYVDLGKSPLQLYSDSIETLHIS